MNKHYHISRGRHFVNFLNSVLFLFIISSLFISTDSNYDADRKSQILFVACISQKQLINYFLSYTSYYMIMRWSLNEQK